MKRLVAIILILSSPAAIFAQAVANAQIHGVITDSSGAVVPGAKRSCCRAIIGRLNFAAWW
jgi:hypothetical protein